MTDVPCTLHSGRVPRSWSNPDITLIDRNHVRARFVAREDANEDAALRPLSLWSGLGGATVEGERWLEQLVLMSMIEVKVRQAEGVNEIIYSQNILILAVVVGGH